MGVTNKSVAALLIGISVAALHRKPWLNQT